ncbi:thioredoxin family protein [Sphaerotilus sp.]|jgi:thioredoxin 1|uniref:thioredoxin family protein n=1 Tax=Sphaerotilus sp. TaxID=2093942 RepID=UPI0025FA558C|nr:thioredoxin family protein [Sphaerotilus sp.]
MATMQLTRPLLIALAVLAVPVAYLGYQRYLKTDPPGPYDRRADAQADLGRAVDQARRENKRVLVVFGANWCPDCRELATDMANPALGIPIAARFVVTKVDVGHFDRNGRTVTRMGNPVDKGIPAVVVLDGQGQQLGTATGPQLAAVRKARDPATLVAALDRLAAPQ